MCLLVSHTQAEAEREARIKEEVQEIKKTFYCEVRSCVDGSEVWSAVRFQAA